MSARTVSSPVHRGDIPLLPMRRFTVEEYHMMARAGVFKSGDPFELLEGWIVPKMTKNPAHVWAVQKLGEWLESHVPAGWYVRRQDPITTSESEPEPDLAVTRGSRDDYLQRHPEPHELALVVEIADTTLAHDRNTKARVYARAGIAAYWIVNLVDEQIEVYRDPSGPTPLPSYHQRRDYRPDEIVPLVIAGQEIAGIPARQLLP